MTASFSHFSHLLREFVAGIIGPSGKYYPGDHVQSPVGGPLMIVQWTKYCKKTKSFIVNCIWFDADVKINRVETFREQDLKPFDWYDQK